MIAPQQEMIQPALYDLQVSSKVVILPHWHTEGGAGFYIQDLITLLQPCSQIGVAGKHAISYNHNPIMSPFLNRLGALSIPAYEGIRFRATFFHLFVSLWNTILLFLTPRRFRYTGAPATFIFTSSVQALAVPLTRHLFPSSKIVIAVQENVVLSNGFGRIVARLLRKSDTVISISESWATHARRFGIDPVVLHNGYDLSYADPEQNLEPAKPSDLLYVGGGAPIKGFDEFVAALPRLLSYPGRRIVCLGSYDATAHKKLEQLGANARLDSELVIIGKVPDIRPYLRGTKLLLLPIGSPHFCRPAIEAGLFRKTFIIPNFAGLDDFANNGENCQMYDPGDAGALVALTEFLLAGKNRAELESSNERVALEFVRPVDKVGAGILMKILSV
jgi:glycosyltransferase involved in cell wall biosynthesis